MKRLRLGLAGLVLVLSFTACDAASITASDCPPRPGFPTMGSGC